MKLFFLYLLFSFFFLPAYSQNSFKALIKEKGSYEPLPGVNVLVEDSSVGGVTNQKGFIRIDGISNGNHTLIFSFIGYKSLRRTILVPQPDKDTLIVMLEPDVHELEQVFVSATRGSRTIDDIPTRVEVITSEELGEKAVMNSSNISMLLRESTGIMVQQTSANSANSSIRVQGLDGRYTQILRDGFPLFGGFSSGLSIMQIPPLDLAQVEVIKGSASTLYGGGAIAGLVNLVSKVPEEDPELSVMINQTSALGTTLNGFYAEDFGKTGLTVYASGSHQTPYDPNEDGFSAIPLIRSLSVNPKLFYHPNEKTRMSFGLNTTVEKRIGGDIEAIKGNRNDLHAFTETNLSNRLSTQFNFERKIHSDSRFSVKNSVSYFDRTIVVPSFDFSGKQWASFSEVTYSTDQKNADWVFGGNFYTDQFRETTLDTSPRRDYSNNTLGFFAQNNWDMLQSLTLESGLRADYNTAYGSFFLPRFSLLYNLNQWVTTRVGGGLGYKIPTIFTEDAERLIFQKISPLNPATIQAETSLGGNFDVNFKLPVNENLFLTINQLFFITELKNSLILNEGEMGNFRNFENADGPITSTGFETNLKLEYRDFHLFFNYAYIDAQLKYLNPNQQKPLTPKHNAGATLMYETEDWMIGYELYYTGEQYLSDYSQTSDFWMMGFMVMRNFKNLSLFINFENFTDTRQSRYQSMIIPPTNNPSFPEIWAPTEGFVANGGIKINLFPHASGH